MNDIDDMIDRGLDFIENMPQKLKEYSKYSDNIKRVLKIYKHVILNHQKPTIYQTV